MTSALRERAAPRDRLTVVRLERKADDHVVQYFRDKLAMAERGEILGFLCVVETADGDSAYRRILLPGCRPARIIGEIELAKAKLCADEAERLGL